MAETKRLMSKPGPKPKSQARREKAAKAREEKRAAEAAAKLKRKKEREGISAQQVARLLELTAVRRVVTLDIHAQAIGGFFQTATMENLHASGPIEDLMNTAILSGELPNLVAGYANAVAGWANEGVVVDIGRVLENYRADE